MSLSLHSATDVFIFIIFCSIYVCSILWIYGDAATRGAGLKGTVLPLLFIIAGTIALILGYNIVLIVWPVGYVLWFFVRPKTSGIQAE